MEETPQKSLERYDVLDRIAVGGMAEVFLAKAYGAHGFEKTLAIKRILPELARDPEFEARFIAEAKVSVRLSHANVVQVLDFGRIGESLFIAMEYVDGLDLAAMQRKFKDEGRLIPLPAAFHIAIEIIRALDYAHQHNVVHRDISPSNILISRAGEVKIADFGIAVAAQPHRAGGAGPKKVMGKWRYMSPEQTRGDTLDTRSDLFSAAVVMFELFTGEKLFPGDESEDIIKNIDRMPIPKMASMRSGIPSRLDEVLAPSLSRKPIDRPNRPATVLRALIELSYESSIMATALDVAEALGTVIPARRDSTRGALDDVIRKQLGQQQEKSVARRTAVTNNKPPSTETVERNDVSTGLFRKLDDDGLARLEIDPTAVRHTEPMEKPEVGDITDLHRLFSAKVDPDRHTEVGGPPTGNVGKIEPGGSVRLPASKQPPKRRGVAVGIGAIVILAAAVGITALVWNGSTHGVQPIASADAAVVPPDPVGTLELDSIPSGATIVVDGQQLGTGPVRMPVHATKKVHVTMTLHGYQPFETDVPAEVGKTGFVKPPLVVAPAQVKVTTVPPGVEVRLHDVLIGTTPFTSKPLAAEAHAPLILSKTGFETAKLEVDLKPGDTAEVTQTLKETKKFGYVSIAITSKPNFAEVYFSGGNIGRNVLKNGKGLTAFKLPVGRQKLLVKNSLGKQTIVDVDIVADQNQTVTISLD